MVRTAGSKSFTSDETSVLLSIVEKLRPFTKTRWEEVAQAFNEEAVERSMVMRDADALKRRFMVLAYGKKSSDNWQDSVLRAMQLHHSIMAENGELDQAPRLSLGGMVTAEHSDHMLLLQDDDALHTYDDDGNRLTPRMTPLPVRTGKRGRPLGSTTGAAAKRMQKQAEQVAYLLSAVTQIQEQMREVREALATVVDTQSNQAAIIAAIQQHLNIRGSGKAATIGSHEEKLEHEELSKQLREAAKAALNYQVNNVLVSSAEHHDDDEEDDDDDEMDDVDHEADQDQEEDDDGLGDDMSDAYNVNSEPNAQDDAFGELC